MSEDKKKVLIEKGIKAGIGNKKFLEGVSIENLEGMIKAIEDRDGEISLLKEAKKEEAKNTKITTVADLVKAKRINVRPVEEPEKKGGKNATKDKA